MRVRRKEANLLIRCLTPMLEAGRPHSSTARLRQLFRASSVFLLHKTFPLAIFTTTPIGQALHGGTTRNLLYAVGKIFWIKRLFVPAKLIDHTLGGTNR